MIDFHQLLHYYNILQLDKLMLKLCKPLLTNEKEFILESILTTKY